MKKPGQSGRADPPQEVFDGLQGAARRTNRSNFIATFRRAVLWTTNRSRAPKPRRPIIPELVAQGMMGGATKGALRRHRRLSSQGPKFHWNDLKEDHRSPFPGDALANDIKDSFLYGRHRGHVGKVRKKRGR